MIKEIIIKEDSLNIIFLTAETLAKKPAKGGSPPREKTLIQNNIFLIKFSLKNERSDSFSRLNFITGKIIERVIIT